MIEGRRLIGTAALLALAVAICYSNVLGEPARDKNNDQWRADREKPASAVDPLAEHLVASKFSDNKVLTYKTAAGETLFALQVQPALPPAEARPRDYLVLIDTSASQAQGPLAIAQQLTEALVKNLGVSDRVAILTANIHCKDLTGGFKSFDGTQAGLKALKDEYPSGATNLNEALKQSIKTFDANSDHQRVLLFMGDGLSLRDPLISDERNALARDMVEKEIAFFPVPLGPRLDPQTLHGLATGTGGAPVRVLRGDRIEDTLQRLKDTVAAPILYPKDFTLKGEVAESFPGKVPPLRGDMPTLVVGRLRGGDTIGYSVTGTVAGREQTCQKDEKVPEPEMENFYLATMLDQWRADKDAPALIRADRALAYASETGQLARADLVAQAEWALGEDKWDVAEKLFEQAQKLDPANSESSAGLDVVKQLRTGKINKEQLRDRFAPKADDMATRIQKDGQGVKVSKERLLALAQAGAGDRKPDAPVQGPQAGPDILQDARQRQLVEDQRTTQIVDEAVRQSGRLLRTDPDAAHEQLKRTLDAVRNNPDLSERTRAALTGRLEMNLRSVDTQGVLVKQDLQERMERLMRAEQNRVALALQATAEEQIRERMRVFHNLMNEAREEQAQAQAQAIREDLVNRGLPVPPAVTAAYFIGQTGHHLREEQELVRIRQDRFLATLLQVEKDSVPFPDEPPVAFPPAPVWREITKLRKERYESSGLGPDTPGHTKELRDLLSRPVKFSGFEADPKMTLQEALDHLADRYGLTFDVNEAAFKAEMVDDVLSKPVAEKAIPKMSNVSLETVLRKILSRITTQSGITYLIRRDSIEITTGAYALAEKVIRVYPVADLVIPIPSTFNQQMAGTLASVLGTGGFAGGLGALGGGFGALGALGGGLGALGALGGGLGALGALGGGLGALGGGLGALGALGGGLGALGGGLGAQGGVIGQLGGQANLGFGGGVLGFGGGQLGQLGNLGGQFGIQGGNQSMLLIRLIRQVIGTPRDWAPLRGVNTFGLPNQENQPDDPNSDPLGNDLGFYPPALALVVKGTSRIHTNSPTLLTAPNANPPGMGRLDNGVRDEALVRIDGKQNNTKVAGDVEKQEDKDAKKVVRNKPPMWDADPRTVWQEALAKGVEEPGLIVATADYLVQANRFDHAAEFLKANLRQGIVVRPWVYEALALALRESKASPEEIERAEMSVADLEPLDSRGFLKASASLAGNKHFDAALALSRQAATLEPDVPFAYEDALRYAKEVKDTGAMEWAAGNLLKRDWPQNNDDLHARATEELKRLAGQLEATNRDAAEQLRTALDRQRERDFVIRLSWAGKADLDLKVEEPTGSTCSWMNRQTVGGGILIGDTLPGKKQGNENSETYIASRAFSGEYRITVDTVWGKPLGNKAKLEIIQHQGTPQETTRLVTLNFAESNTAQVKLADGRRTEAASVPPQAAAKRPAPPADAPASTDQVLGQLRAMTDPGDPATIQGSAFSLGVPTSLQPVAVKPDKNKTQEQVTYQTRVAPFVNNTIDLTAQATVSADRRYVRLSMTPMFNVVTGTQLQSNFSNPLLPGGRR
jgi:hypothetical protein